MCGLAAIMRRAGDASADVERIHRALAALSHRGPDGMGVERVGPVTLGMKRLAIVGLANGRQPLSNQSGGIVAVVNGEFYDHEAIRARLKAQGHVFHTESDSEVLIHLYEQYDLQALEHLRGEFAFVLWDSGRQRLLAGRDRFGIKPLCYTESQDGLRFASEAKGLLAMGHPAAWDHGAMAAALTHQYLRPDQTYFAGIKAVPPATVMIVEGGQCRQHQYWRPIFSEEPAPKDAVEQIRHVWEESTRLRLRADAPIACALSAGLDSSSIAIQTARLLGRPVDCFTVSFDADGYDEVSQVRRDLDTLPETLNSHVVPVTRRQLATELPAAIRQSEGLAINGQLVGKYLLNQAIRKAGYKVVLAGEGADETFHGYAHLQADYARWRGLATEVDFPLQRGIMLPDAQTASNARQSLPTFLQAKFATGQRIQQLLHPDWKLDPAAEWRLTSQSVMREDLTPPREAAWLWTRLALASYILRTLGDGMEMGHSVEARLPYLDHKLFDLAAALPTDCFYQQGHSKSILREALSGLMPDTMRLRPKHPFIAPPLLGSGDPVAWEFVHDTLSSQTARDLPFFSSTSMQKWLERLPKAPDEAAATDSALMTLLSITLLAQSYRL
jgi:asparagine synthase (glutamine-hydrolysing)